MFSFKSTKSQRGQATVEFALTALIFFTVFLAIVEFSHLFYTKLTLQYALREAGRYMVTGRTEDGIDRVQAVRDVFCKNLIGTGLTCPATLPMNPTDGGGPGDLVTASVTFTKPWFTGISKIIFPKDSPLRDGITLNVSTTWKNEPF